MNSQMVFTAILAIVLTPVVSFLKQENWPTQVKYLLAMGISFVAASAEVIINNQPTTWTQYSALVGIAIATTQSIYQLYFSGSDFEKVVQGAFRAKPKVQEEAPKEVEKPNAV